jgi:hypothetical protein
MNASIASFALVLSIPIGSAFGWGALGHQVVADLAQDMLTPKARAEAAALLGPSSGGGAGGASFRLSSVSVWADDIKTLRPQTRPWHYATIQLDEPGYRAGVTDSPNVVTALAASLAVLGDAKADRYAREEALKWVVHLVGDLHQPLHVGEDKDKGGNLAKVKVGRRTENLHAVWDYVLLERLHLPADSLRALLAASLAADPARIARHAQGTVVSWADETHLKARACYTFRGKPLKKGIAVSLDRTYTRPNTWVILDQLQIAAVRLASSLNRALDPAAPAVPPLPTSARVTGAGHGARVDSAAFFRAADPDPADSADPAHAGKPAKSDKAAAVPSAGSGASGSGGRFAWSAKSEVYHYADCADVKRIKKKNLQRGDSPPPGLPLHPGCPKKEGY